MVRDYETAILKKVIQFNQQKPKSVVAHAVKGNYNKALDVIEQLRERNILEIKDGKLKIKPNDVLQDHKHFQTILEISNETISNLIPKLKKIVKTTNEPLVWFEIIKLSPTSEPARMDHINKKAKADLLFLMSVVRDLVGGTFMLYQKIILDQVSKSEKKLLNDDIKTGIDTIQDIKEQLLKLSGKKNKHIFAGYWFEMTAGLRI